jgi:hypothetical protein
VMVGGAVRPVMMAETERGARRRERGVERRMFDVVVVVVVEDFVGERERRWRNW